ncbi:MAG TPA: D-glycerate dehydrogenase [Desulfatirhabdiaceae bacterium]|nr:D-glycerate dehydrogenase [Desulfatirhabdiaceae bacterium]
MNILVTQRLPEEVMTMLHAAHTVVVGSDDRPMSPDTLIRQIARMDGLLSTISDRIDADVMDAAPGLKIIANYGVGTNHIDLKAATMRGILVSNTPDVLTDATADLAFALILALARRIVEGDHRTRSGRFRYWAPLEFLGTEVSGKTLGIVGMGRIGRAVARRAAGFNMNVVCATRKNSSQPDMDGPVGYTDLNNLLKISDFVSLHVPLTPETHHLIGKDELEKMKPTAFLINTSRGPVVDEAALTGILYQNRIAGAGLDVYEHEPALTPGLADLSNCILLPHVGSATIETRTRMGMMAAKNLLEGLAGRIPTNSLNHQALR